MRQVLEFAGVELFQWDVVEDLENVYVSCEEFKSYIISVIATWFPDVAELLACVAKAAN